MRNPSPYSYLPKLLKFQKFPSNVWKTPTPGTSHKVQLSNFNETMCGNLLKFGLKVFHAKYIFEFSNSKQYSTESMMNI